MQLREGKELSFKMNILYKSKCVYKPIIFPCIATFLFFVAYYVCEYFSFKSK